MNNECFICTLICIEKLGAQAIVQKASGVHFTGINGGKARRASPLLARRDGYIAGPFRAKGWSALGEDALLSLATMGGSMRESHTSCNAA
jgi:hypothetical protein